MFSPYTTAHKLLACLPHYSSISYDNGIILHGVLNHDSSTLFTLFTMQLDGWYGIDCFAYIAESIKMMVNCAPLPSTLLSS